MTMVSDADVAAWHRAFEDLVVDRFGLVLGEEARTSFPRALVRTAEACGYASLRAYFRAVYCEGALESPEVQGLIRAVVDRDSSFFSDRAQLNALEQCILSSLEWAPGARSDVRILSAGCGEGEEAYTLAILARRAFEPGSQVRVHGIDLDVAAIARARGAIYGPSSLRACDAAEELLYFREIAADRFAVVRPYREEVTFACDNLLVAPEGRNELDEASDARFDLIVCRDVAKHLAPPFAQQLYRRLATQLSADGYLMIGARDPEPDGSDPTKPEGSGARRTYGRAAKGDRIGEELIRVPNLPPALRLYRMG